MMVRERGEERRAAEPFCKPRMANSSRHAGGERRGRGVEVLCNLECVLILCEHVDDAYPSCLLREHPYPQLWVVGLMVLMTARCEEEEAEVKGPEVKTSKSYLPPWQVEV